MRSNFLIVMRMRKRFMGMLWPLVRTTPLEGYTGVLKSWGHCLCAEYESWAVFGRPR